jgi:hypothetical protein
MMHILGPVQIMPGLRRGESVPAQVTSKAALIPFAAHSFISRDYYGIHQMSIPV